MQLDPQQKKAVEATERSVLVLAGAGSGKTRVLTERIAHLIENCKVSPFEILAFSFTRKASGEIRDRLEACIGTQAHKCLLGTMHGIALNMVRKMGDTIGLKPKAVTVYGSFEEQFLLKEVAKELGMFKKGWNPKKKDIDAAFNAYYDSGRPPGDQDPVKPLFDAFMSRCRENNALTYSGLLIALEMLLKNMAKYLHIRHIIIDETQDISLFQWKIINEMRVLFNAELYVVGDVSQCIYSWRGAYPEYLPDHESDFTVYRLETNYRSQSAIVNAANRLIEFNKLRLDLMMQPSRNGDNPIAVVKNTDSAGLVSLLRPFRKDGATVLCRTHAPLKKLSSLLDDAGIDHTYIGRKSDVIRTEEFARFHAFLKLMVNPYDNFAFLLIKDLIGLGKKEYSRIRLNAIHQGNSHFDVWLETTDDDRHFFIDREPFEDKVLGIRYLGDENERYETARDFAMAWINDNPNGSISDYLSWLATYDLQDEMTEDTEPIILSTIHGAKGLEWPTVIIAGCNEGLLPSKQAVEPDDIESERRLAYVAMTRAEDQLVLTVRPEVTQTDYGKTYINPASRFLNEAGLPANRELCTATSK